jgi:hypothetical protein
MQAGRVRSGRKARVAVGGGGKLGEREVDDQFLWALQFFKWRSLGVIGGSAS